MRGPWWCAVLLLSLVHVELSVGWEAYELDLFDLVEEIGLSTSFYEFIGVEKTAETSEIKKAYRYARCSRTLNAGWTMFAF